MDDWSKKLVGHLEQNRAVAIALKEIEQISGFNQTAADYALKASLELENQRAALLRTVQDQSARLHAESRNWAVYSDFSRLDRFSTANEIRRAQEANQLHLAKYSSSAIDEVTRIAELAQTYTLHASLDPFRTSVASFANKLLHLQTLDTIRSPAYLDAVHACLDDF